MAYAADCHAAFDSLVRAILQYKEMKLPPQPIVRVVNGITPLPQYPTYLVCFGNRSRIIS